MRLVHAAAMAGILVFWWHKHLFICEGSNLENDSADATEVPGSGERAVSEAVIWLDSSLPWLPPCLATLTLVTALLSLRAAGRMSLLWGCSKVWACGFRASTPARRADAALGPGGMETTRWVCDLQKANPYRPITMTECTRDTTMQGVTEGARGVGLLSSLGSWVLKVE